MLIYWSVCLKHKQLYLINRNRNQSNDYNNCQFPHYLLSVLLYSYRFSIPKNTLFIDRVNLKFTFTWLPNSTHVFFMFCWIKLGLLILLFLESFLEKVVHICTTYFFKYDFTMDIVMPPPIPKYAKFLVSRVTFKRCTTYKLL